MSLFGAIEAGGTKFVCAVGTGADDVRDQSRFATTTPVETMERALDFFREQEARLGALTAIGVASFGPVDLDPRSSTFGHILSTPKAGWAGADLVGPIRRAFNIPVAFDTDVNGALLGEWRWGAGRGLSDLVYLTVGTGIGGGAMVKGQLVHGLVHPEMGHIHLPHDRQTDPFPGGCPFHGDCLEGLASGPAIEARWGRPAQALPPDHPAWRLEAHYLAHALVNYVCILSPQRIILGGGVMAQKHLFPHIGANLQAYLNGYISSPAILENIAGYVVPPGLGDQAGVLGAMALAIGEISNS